MTWQPEPRPQPVRVYLRPGHQPWDHPERRPLRSREDSIEGALGRSIWSIGAPWEHWVLVFDTETTTETDQLPRVGCWLLAGMDPNERVMWAKNGKLTRELLDQVFDVGFFYDPRRVSGQELSEIRRFAVSDKTRQLLKELGLVYPSPVLYLLEQERLQAMSPLEQLDFLQDGPPDGPPARVTMEENFVRDILYRWGYEDGALIVGHNLPFDIAALAEDWDAGRWVDGSKSADEKGKKSPYQSADPRRPGQWIDHGLPQAEGFTLHLCRCADRGDDPCYTHPPVRARHIARAVNFMRFQHRDVPAKGGEDRYSDAFDGRFLDTLTLGRVLRAGSSGSLEALSAAFGVPYTKREVDLSGPIDGKLLTYLLEDVLATWQLFQRERDEYRRFGLSRDIHQIYSGATLAKGIEDEMGFPDWMARHGEAVQEVLGPAMTAYYGARSEVAHRLAEVECLYFDFHAQYPAVISLMELQRYLLAERITVERGERIMRKVRDILGDPVTLLARLLDSATWKELPILCLVRPNGDRLPYRSFFQESGHAANIADCSVYPGVQPSWWTLADVAASVIRTGRVPEIQDALSLIPHGQVETRPFALYGDSRFVVDLNRGDDLAVKLVEARAQAQREADALPEGSPERLQLEGVARAAKIIVNSIYGITVEIISHARTAKARPMTRHGLEVSQVWTHTPETEGPRFAGPVGTHITAGGRLLEAMAAQMGLDRGIEHAACDTDSMTYARPNGMDRETFVARCLEIQAAFERLNPFSDGPFFELEDRNFALEQGPDGKWQKTDRLEPLYYIGVCPKRGVYHNITPNSKPRIRAYSMHGITLSNPELLEAETDGEEDAEAHEESLAGMDRVLAGYRSPADIPAPAGDVAKMAGGVGRRWVYDLYYRFIERIRSGITWDRDLLLDTLITDGSLDVPALRQVTMTAPSWIRRYGDRVPVRPYSFLSEAGSFTEMMLLRRDQPDLDQVWAMAHEEIEARLMEREEAQHRERELFSAIRDCGGIDPASLGEDFQDVPVHLRRVRGFSIDVVAAQMGPPFAYVQDFVNEIVRVKQRWEMLAPLSRRRLWRDIYNEWRRSDDEPSIVGATLYAPTCKTTKELLRSLRRADTGQRVLMLPPTIREVMRTYFCRPNYKMADPHGIGEMERRHVRPEGKLVYVGKETNRLLAELNTEAEAVEVTTVLGEPKIGPLMQQYTLDELAWAIPAIEPKYLQRYHEGKHEPKADHRTLILAGLVELESGKRPPTWEETRPRLQARGVGPVAERLDMRPRDLRRYLEGGLIPGRTLLWQIARVLGELDAKEYGVVEPELVSGPRVTAL